MQALSEGLVRRGEQVTVLTSRARSSVELYRPNRETTPLPDREHINGVEVRRVGINHSLRTFLFNRAARIRGWTRLRPLLLDQEVMDMLQLGPLSPGVCREILRFRPDVVLTLNAFYATGYFSYVMKKLYGYPWVLIPSLYMGTDLQHRHHGPTLKRLLTAADLVIALTEFEKHVLIERGCDDQRIVVVGVGTDPAAFHPPRREPFRQRHHLTDEPIVLFLGRRSPGKGIDTLIDAMPTVWQTHPRARLVLAGMPEVGSNFGSLEEAKLRALTATERAKVILVDHFSQTEKAEIYGACDLFAMPAQGESFGIVYLEAWASSRPIIACRGFAPSSYIEEGKDGLLVAYGNSHEVAAAIVKLLESKALRDDLGKNGRQKVLEHYTWDIVVERVHRAYVRLLERKRRSHRLLNVRPWS